MKRTIVYLVVALCVVGSVRADQTVQSVQQALTEQGFYYGNVTGDNSSETTAAIRRYQIRNGLQVTGEINPETLRSLNVNSNSASSSQSTSKPAITQSNSVRPNDTSRPGQNAPPRSLNEPDRQLETNPAFANAPYQSVPRWINGRIAVAEVQHQLMTRGYYRGRVDGRYGRRTAFAVRAFQFHSGLPPTGRFDMTTLGALGMSDWNAGYLESTPRSFEDWAPVRKFGYGKGEEEWNKKWEEEWKKHHRDDDKYGDDAGDGKLKHGKWEHGKWKVKWEKHHRDDDGDGHGHGD
jgi:peptidoglycan hydrolase-like protein with peptidoglycan-binding domain